MAFPSPWQQKAIEHMHGHMQIVACAGSGKTETIAARIVKLLTSGIKPEEIVAFTFTNRAADELLHRIRNRAQAACVNSEFSQIYPRIALLQCSTMHSFCFGLLRRIDPSYDIYEILSEHQEYALLLRLGVSLGLSGGKQSLKYTNDVGASCRDEIESYLASLDVVHNELLDDLDLLKHAPNFIQVYNNYRAMLDRQKILSYGLIIEEAVAHLKSVSLSNHPLRGIKYLFVDEYQDTNTAQEHLIYEFAKLGAEICVVGDDDQCIYEWRGSNVKNFLGFSDKYKATVYELPENRRCQPRIFAAAEGVVNRIKERKKKTMIEESGLQPINLKRITAENPDHEANLIIEEIKSITSGDKDYSYSYNEIAILLRSITTSGEFILNKLSEANIPFRLIGSTALLDRPSIDVFRLMLFAWAESIGVGPSTDNDASWESYFRSSLEDFSNTFIPSRLGEPDEIEKQILNIGYRIAESKRPNLVNSLMRVFSILNLNSIDPDLGRNPGLLADIGSFTNLVADVQAVFLRNLADSGPGDGKTLLNDITWFIVRYALSNYEANLDFDPSLVNAVSVCTIHQSKGLEWPVVFIPSLIEGRFPPTGKRSYRLIPDSLYDNKRYDAKFAENEDPERRLFHVAVTRAKERLTFSDFKRIKIQRKPSPFYNDIPSICYEPTNGISPRSAAKSITQEINDITCSELVEYLRCPSFYRFRRMWKWQFDLPEELGYGTSLHQLANMVIKENKGTSNLAEKLDEIVEKEFHLPYASVYTRSELKEKAKLSMKNFYTTFMKYLDSAEMSEQDIVFLCNDVRINCRPDVLIRMDQNSYWVIDLKNIRDFKPQRYDEHQIHTYVMALGFMGIKVNRGSFYNFVNNEILDVDISEGILEAAENVSSEALNNIKEGYYAGVRNTQCRDCDYRLVCYFNK